MRHLSALTGASLLALAGQAAVAQTAFELDEITFSANLAPTAQSSTGSSVTIVERDELEAAGDVQLSSYLSRLPGISITQTGPLGAQTDMRIRGLQPRLVSVYVDGILVNDPTSPTGAYDFGSLTTAGLERIEILRGPQSAIYGGSAAAGVVSITTRQLAEDGVEREFRAEAGSMGTVALGYDVAQRSGRLGVTYSLSQIRSDGFSAAEAGTERDGFEVGRLAFSTRYDATDSVVIGAAGFLQRARNDYDSFLADADNEQLRREGGLRFFVESDGDARREVFEITGYRQLREDRTGTATPDNFAATRLAARYVGTSFVAPDLTISYGADVTWEKAWAPSIAGGADSTVGGVFIEGLWSPTDRLDVSGNLRVDENSDFGRFKTGRVALSYRVNESVTLRASAGTGFRAPSISERFGSSGGSFPFQGDPDLKPERSRNLDLGVDMALDGGASVGVTLFATQTTDLITPTFCPFDPVAVACVAGTSNGVENTPGRSRSRGVEIEASLPLTQWAALGLGYTYTDARDQGGDRLLRVPRHDVALRLDADLTDRLHATVSAHALADRLDFRTDFTQGPVPGYGVVNTAFRYELTETADLTLRIDNLFDKQYQTVAGYGTSDRAVYVGLSSRF
jgi:vitamin B12 transporter